MSRFLGLGKQIKKFNNILNMEYKGRHKKSKGIPDRWLDYTKVGTVIEGTPFIAFKVPLKAGLSSSLESKEKFSPACLVNKVPNLGLVIDLTFTSRYYQPEEFLVHGIKYSKIMCAGRSVPAEKEFTRFSDAVNSFSGSANGKIIGVHCTHGLNRTGYMICRYMIQNMGFAPEKAVKAFEKARGHKMERIEYVEALGYSPPPGERHHPRGDRENRHDRRVREIQPQASNFYSDYQNYEYEDQDYQQQYRNHDYRQSYRGDYDQPEAAASNYRNVYDDNATSYSYQGSSGRSHYRHRQEPASESFQRPQQSRHFDFEDDSYSGNSQPRVPNYRTGTERNRHEQPRQPRNAVHGSRSRSGRSWDQY